MTRQCRLYKPTREVARQVHGNTERACLSHEPRATKMNKPPYRVPSMAEISAMPHNGFNVVSTFSGCGGSCLGYRMAGFRVLWANEFIPIAQASYKANHPDSILDGRDIHDVQPEEILVATGLKQGELDLFDGSPPCQAFSTAGKRHKGWGEGKTYENGKTQCNETLFDEYVRLLRGLMPRVFVAENVSGLVKGTAKGYFLDILKALKESGYNVKVQCLDAQWLGVPQMRQRVIFQGVRNDIDKQPAFPTPLPYRYSVRDALPWIDEKAQIVHPSGFGKDSPDSPDSPLPSVMAQGSIGGMGSGQTFIEIGTERRKFTIAEVKRICAFPDDFVLIGSYAQQWERLGNAVPPVMMRHIAETVRDKVLT